MLKPNESYYEARTPRQAEELYHWTGLHFELGDRMSRWIVEYLRDLKK